MKVIYVICDNKNIYVSEGFYVNPLNNKVYPNCDIDFTRAKAFQSHRAAWDYIECKPYMVGTFEIKKLVVKDY